MKKKLWKKNEQLFWGKIVWLVLHDFYSINIWFTSPYTFKRIRKILQSKILLVVVPLRKLLYVLVNEFEQNLKLQQQLRNIKTFKLTDK
jgi:hypothetical protein